MYITFDTSEKSGFFQRIKAVWAVKKSQLSPKRGKLQKAFRSENSFSNLIKLIDL